MDEFSIVKESLQLLNRDLGLEANVAQIDSDNPYERLLDLLEKEVKRMMDVDFINLLNALYRIDLPEKEVASILEMTDPDEIPRTLAAKILNREKRKVITRQQYRQQ